MKRNAQRGKNKGRFESQLFIEYLLIAILFGVASLTVASSVRDGLLASLSNLTSFVERTNSLEPGDSTPPPDAKPQQLQLGINTMQ